MNKNMILDLLQDRSINIATNEIYLHSHISHDEDEPGIDYRAAIQFIKNFNFLNEPNDKPILIHLNSIGGDVAQGMAIFDLIKQSKKHITIVGYGEVSSMSSIIIQAADTRLLMENAVFMVHNANLGYSLTPIHGINSYMQFVNRQENEGWNIYAERCVKGKFFVERGYNINKVKSFLKRKVLEKLDWYLTAQEALDYGFIDGIIGSSEYPSIEDIMYRS